MNRRQHAKQGIVMGRRLALTALLAAGLPALAACTTDVNGALVIVQNQVPESEDGICLIPSKGDTVRLISGTFDVDLDRDYPYFLYPLVRNGLPPLADEGRVETNRIEYEGVEVKIEPPPGVDFPGTDACPNEFAFNERYSLAPEAEIGSKVQVLLPCHSALLRQMFNAGALPSDFATHVRFRVSVRAVGKHTGSTLKSEPFEYVIRVCKGCLQRGYQEGYAVFDYPNVPKCDALETNPYQGNPCNPAQDQIVMCCLGSAAGATLDCPGRPRPPE